MQGRFTLPCVAGQADKQQAAPEPEVEAQEGAPAEKHTAAEWAERAAWFSVGEGVGSQHAMVGAFHGEDPDKRFTREQAQRRLEKFLSTEIEAEA